jgi:zinc and cadmium transporter
MPILALIVAFTTAGGLLSGALAGTFLLLPPASRARLLPHLVSFATGALLGAALLGLIPEAIAGVGLSRVDAIGVALVGGIGVFFVLEKLLIWRHSHGDGLTHDHGIEVHTSGVTHRDRAVGSLVVVGDGIHNALDGVLIAAAFLTSTRLGIVTAVAIMAHEIPQEMGDFAVLLHSGMPYRRALILNIASSLTSIIGGLGAYFALRQALGLLPYALAIAAASLIYIAVADLIPGLHRRIGLRDSVTQVVLIGAGVALIAFMEQHAH